MLKRSVTIIIGALFVLGPTLSAYQTPAPDLTGTWSGKAVATRENGPPGEEALLIVLKQTGTAISGTAGPNADRQQEINTGKVETSAAGTKLVFETGRPGHVLRFDLRLADGRLKGTVKDEFYPNVSIAIDVARAK